MYDNTIKDKFVGLRAAGKSFGDIAQELGIVKSTLHRWEDERADDIARLRRIQWEETEARFSVRLEDQLEGLACDLRDYESHLSKYNLKAISVREALMLVRETRRAYFQTRAILMGPAPRSRPPRKSSLSCAPKENGPSSPGNGSVPSASSRLGVEPLPKPESNETERSAHNTETQPHDTNDLQQSASHPFDFPNRPASGPDAADNQKVRASPPPVDASDTAQG